MRDPKLLTAQVQINVECDDGYLSEETFGFDSHRHRPGPVLLSALEELARLTALHGLEQEALERFNGARERVAAFKAQRSKA